MYDLIYKNILQFRFESHPTGRHTDASFGADYNFLALMHQGCGRFIGEGYDIEFAPGDMYYVPFGFKYHSYWYGDDPIVWDAFAFRWFPVEQSYPIQKLYPDEKQLEIYNKLAGLHRVDCSTIGMFYDLLASLLPTMKPSESHRSELVERAKAMMNENPKLPIGEVAKRLGVSESGLYTSFRHMGTTPVSKRLKFQLNRAIELLITTDLTVEAICDSCGFGSETYFYRVLRRMTGMTTRELRRGQKM